MAWIYRIGPLMNALTLAESENNATQFYNYFNGYMTIEAMAGILGNIYYECWNCINPGAQEVGKAGSTQYGYGMIQWTPGYGLINWCNNLGLDWYDGDAQCYRIKCEGEGIMGVSGSWIPTTLYPYTWAQYCALTSWAEATRAYFAERERGHWAESRLEWASYFYEYLSGQGPTPPTPPPPGPPVNYSLFGGARDVIRRLIIHA